MYSCLLLLLLLLLLYSAQSCSKLILILSHSSIFTVILSKVNSKLTHFGESMPAILVRSITPVSVLHTHEGRPGILQSARAVAKHSAATRDRRRRERTIENWSDMTWPTRGSQSINKSIKTLEAVTGKAAYREGGDVLLSVVHTCVNFDIIQCLLFTVD